MAKLTDEQIEAELTAACNQPRSGVHDTAMAIARAAFTLGQDNGKAIILEAIDSLIGKPVADAQVGQLGRAMRDVLAWCAAKPTRFFGGIGSDGTSANVFKADGDAADEYGSMCVYAYGADAAESLSKLATWCNEDTAAANQAALDAKFGAVEHADTQPPTAPEPTQPENEAPVPACDVERDYDCAPCQLPLGHSLGHQYPRTPTSTETDG